MGNYAAWASYVEKMPFVRYVHFAVYILVWNGDVRASADHQVQRKSLVWTFRVTCELAESQVAA